MSNNPLTSPIEYAPQSSLQVAKTALEFRKAIGLLDEDEVAAILKLNSTTTLATWRSQGSGPPSVKLGKRVFYTSAGFSHWVNAKIKEQEAEAARLAAGAPDTLGLAA